MTMFVTSADGTRIAFDQHGRINAAPLVIVSGMFCDRETTRDLAEQLSSDFNVINYDRRGRGESGHTPPYQVKREIEDLAALIAQAGGQAAIYGHSSGAGLALEAAAHGLSISRLVLHEPPYGPDDAESREAARDLAEAVREAVDEGRGADAVRLFFEASGMPQEMAAEFASDPKRIGLAATMTNDFAVMGDFSRGGVVPADLVRRIGIPTLVLAGGDSPDFFRDSAMRVVELLSSGELAVLDGADHGAPASVVAPVVAAFLRDDVQR